MEDNSLILPEILDIPEKLLPMVTKFDSFRYALLEGGRGGGKSQAVARFFLYLADKYKVRIICGREVQNSISESVYSLMVDLIRKYKLDFTIQSTKITSNRTGTEINFRGFREQGRFSIQGIEAVDLLWIDEAQAITKQTLDVLIPTIRKEKAKIFFSMNRHVEHDPVYETFVNRKDCLHISINYDDNPFCTEALKNEALECKAKSESDYLHIWKGEPLTKSEDCVFSYKELKDSVIHKYPLRDGYGIKFGGFDVARYGDDKCACIGIQQMGALHWECVFVDQWDHKDLNYTTGRILQLSHEQGFERSVIDEDGLGAGPLDTLNKGRGLDNFIGFRNLPLGFKDNKEYGNNRTKNAYKLKELLLKNHIVITDEELIRELCTLRYCYDNYQRKILVSKDKMKKDGIKSPNLADALLYAVSLIGEVKIKPEEQVYFTTPQYSREANLFSVAGI